MATRRNLLGGSAAALVSTVTAAVATCLSAALPDPDAALLALRYELTAAVAEVSLSELDPEWSDEEVNRVGTRLRDACWAIIEAPRPQTPDGWALKAAASMHEFKFAYSPGGWDGNGEAMAWSVLSEMAGNAYVPWTGPKGLPVKCEPPRER